MSKIQSVVGVMKTLFWLTREELSAMDHKLPRLAAGAIGFAAAALFWYYVFNFSSIV